MATKPRSATKNPQISLRIAVAAPSGPFDAQAYAKGIRVLEKAGACILSHAAQRHAAQYYLNGSDTERLAELKGALEHKDVDAVWLVRGGYGLTRLLGDLKRMRLKTRPVVIGFSDGTALLSHMYRTYGLAGLHGPSIASLAKPDPAGNKALWQILSGQACKVRYPKLRVRHVPSQTSGKPLSRIEGTLIPSNLCVLTHLLGTASFPNLDGCILILEEINEPMYRLDRMLTQLIDSGSLSGVLCVVVGHLTDCNGNGVAMPKAKKHDPVQVFIERMSSIGIPVASHLPMGHEHPNIPVPFGVRGSVVFEKSGARLSVLEEIFASKTR
jgi:muramoyltetrapeptide carboxypeptidase